MTYSHILWDFNGTILNDVEIGMKSANALLKCRNMKTIDSLEDYHNVFCFPIIEYYRRLGFNLEEESYNNLAVQWVEQYLINSKEAKLYDGIVDVLLAMKQHSIAQIILSATEKQMLTKQVFELGIIEYFDDILGLDNIHAYSKVNIARQWKLIANPERAVLIGDTVHDFEVASAINVECILIANGHQSKAVLQSCGVLVLDAVSEILEIGVILG